MRTTDSRADRASAAVHARRLPLALIAVIAGAFMAMACEGRSEIAPEAGSAGSAGATGADASADVVPEGDTTTPVECPQDLPGPVMVAVPAPGGLTYCMDATEVTQADYFVFLEAKGVDLNTGMSGDMSGQRPECEGKNSRFAPYASFNENPLYCSMYPLAFDWSRGHPDYPVGCVDWCDANAYCAWAGKRLCGKIGGGALEVDNATGSLVDVTSSQFYWACSQGGKTVYSYGDQFEPGICADRALAAATPTDAGTSASVNRPAGDPDTCRGEVSPYAQLHDLSGNLGEWQDGCWNVEGVYGAGCAATNVGTEDAPDENSRLRCDTFPMVGSVVMSPAIGFRCCLD